jgi:hypothetical protein
MTIVRTLWRAAKYVIGVIASLGGIACLGFVAGGFVWGLAKRITGTMSDPSGWNEWLSILGGGVLILFGLMIALGAIRELLKYLFVPPRHRSHKPTWGLCAFQLLGLVLLVGGAFCITDAPVFKVPLAAVTLGMMVTLFLEEKEEAKFRKKLQEAEKRATQQPPTTLVQDIREALYGEEGHRTLDDMELSFETCIKMCPHCGNVNILPGLTEMTVYCCQECGRAVGTGSGMRKHPPSFRSPASLFSGGGQAGGLATASKAANGRNGGIHPVRCARQLLSLFRAAAARLRRVRIVFAARRANTE